MVLRCIGTRRVYKPLVNMQQKYTGMQVLDDATTIRRVAALALFVAPQA
jgi:hypothetical protein